MALGLFTFEVSLPRESTAFVKAKDGLGNHKTTNLSICEVLQIWLP